MTASETAEQAAAERAEARNEFYIFVPASPWGGRNATFGPMTKEAARAELDRFVPLYMPECPPKLLRVIEDYECTPEVPA